MTTPPTVPAEREAALDELRALLVAEVTRWRGQVASYADETNDELRLYFENTAKPRLAKAEAQLDALDALRNDRPIPIEHPDECESQARRIEDDYALMRCSPSLADAALIALLRSVRVELTSLRSEQAKVREDAERWRAPIPQVLQIKITTPSANGTIASSVTPDAQPDEMSRFLVEMADRQIAYNDYVAEWLANNPDAARTTKPEGAEP